MGEVKNEACLFVSVALNWTELFGLNYLMIIPASS